MTLVKTSIQEQLLQTLDSVILASIKRPVALHEPAFFGNELKYVSECIETGWVSSVGKYVDLIEEKLCEITGAKYAIAVVNGTAALHLAYMMAGVKAYDEVLVPALTFIATANAVAYCGATPHFVDSNEKDLGVCPVKLDKYLSGIADIHDDVCINKNTGKVIRALCVTHIFGLPAQLKSLKAVCDKYQIALIEDAAEALGSYYQGEHVGHYGLCGIISFNGNKITTTGGGGALLTDDADIAKRAKHLSTTAKIPAKSWEYRYDAIGYNYRMPNINAALGCAQLENLPIMLEKKRKLADRYRKSIAKIEGVNFISESEENQSNYWLNAVKCDFENVDDRNACLKELNAQGYGCRPVWDLLPYVFPYRESIGMSLDCAKYLESSIINLPSGINVYG
jgi:perosamine synthetase